MALNIMHLSLSFLSLFVVSPFPLVESRNAKPTVPDTEHSFTKTLQTLQGVHKGHVVKGVSELRSYLQKFGYLTTNDHSDTASTSTLDDHFDEELEFALKDFQTYHHLDVTGRVDAATIKKMSQRRCGVPDIITPYGNKRNEFANFSFFPGSPKWSNNKRDLTYLFRSSVDVVGKNAVRKAFENAFGSWSDVTDFTFSETDVDDSADIVIGFHRGVHGDGYPFDGPGTVLAHTFAPEDGRQHFDADEKWSTYRRPGKGQTDLETVALHEIGHLIGLGHSSNRDSVMYPYYGGVRRDLEQDDVEGIGALYGYN